jgi:hypothetical protein
MTNAIYAGFTALMNTPHMAAVFGSFSGGGMTVGFSHVAPRAILT